MNEVAYALAIGVAATFAWAGVAKLRAPRRTARAFRALGVPAPLARVVPVVEVALAAAIVVAPRAALGAGALLVAFSIVLARADRNAGCACFGSASTEPVSWVHLMRNAGLTVLAVVSSTAEPAAPGVAAWLCAAGIVAIGALLLALADLRHRIGAVLAVELP